MLSRSIYNLNRALEREFADGEGVGEALHRSLIDVMDHWHEMALDMEAELEACQTRQDQMRPSAGEVVDTATRRRFDPQFDGERKLRLVVDNGGDHS